MNVIRSRFVEDFTSPVDGVAFVEVGGRVHAVQLVQAALSCLCGYEINGDRLADGIVWFEDRREVSH